MVLGVGCVHPPGERAADYDGFYFRADEMSSLARDLQGKPLCIEHDTSHPVGTVREAWVGTDGDVYCLFDTDDDRFAGHLASNLVRQGVCHDLSLGHDVAVGTKGSTTEVRGKVPREVSICVRGARDGTHITAMQRCSSATARKLKKASITAARRRLEQAIPSDRSHVTIMDKTPDTDSQATQPTTTTTTTPDTTKDPAATDAAPAATPSSDVPAVASSFKEELLNLVTRQQAENAVLLERIKAETERRETAEKKVTSLNESNKRKRAAVLEGAVSEMVQSLLQNPEFKKKLEPNMTQLNNIFEGMPVAVPLNT